MSKKTTVDTKSPDAFQVTMYKILDWGLKNKKLLTLLILPVFLIFVGLFSWTYIADIKAESKRLELATIDDLHSVEKKTYDDKKDELQEEITQLTSDPKNKTKNQAKKEKLQKQLESLKPNHKDSLDKYLRFFEQNPSSVAGMRAGVSAANIQINSGLLEDAMATLSKVLSSSPRGEFFNVQVRLMFASVLEELGNIEKSITELDKAFVTAMDSVKPQILFNKGRILLQAGKKESADSVFLELTQKFSTSQEAKKVAAIKIILQ